jgi:hypothetical protein
MALPPAHRTTCCDGNPKSPASCRTFFLSIRTHQPRYIGICGCPQHRKQGTVATATEYFLHETRCTEMHRSAHGSGCSSIHACPTGKARTWTYPGELGGPLSFCVSLAFWIRLQAKCARLWRVVPMGNVTKICNRAACCMRLKVYFLLVMLAKSMVIYTMLRILFWFVQGFGFDPCARRRILPFSVGQNWYL